MPAKIFYTTCVTLALAAAWPAHAANTGHGATWDEIKMLPDWTGVWTWIPDKRPAMPVNAGGQAELDKMAQERKVTGDVTARQKRCMVSGWPSGVGGPEEYSEEWIFTPGQVTMTGAIGFVRRIHTDGRKHHAGPGTIEADSIGHWEGDTLVVDTSSAQEGNELYYGFVGGKNMHGIERIHLSDQNTLTIDLDLDAPDIFSTAYKFPTRLKRHADWTTLEMNCAQNQRSVDEKGNQTMILDKQSYSAGKDEE